MAKDPEEGQEPGEGAQEEGEAGDGETEVEIESGK
jgi:hypothetical protein